MKLTTQANQSGQAWPWIGQSRLGAALLTMLASGRWPATAMFSGPEHLGKSTVARWLAQRDLCREPAAPCGACTDCRAVAAGTHPDFLFIAPDDDHRFGTEEVGQALQGLSWKRASASSSRRWVIIGEVDRLSEHVGNTLLKLIEEPPPATAILLTSSHPERILPTILSRAVHFRWQAVSAAELDLALRTDWSKLSVSLRQAIAAQAAGCPGKAMTLAAHPEALENEWLASQDLVKALTTGRLADRTEWTSTDLDRCERIIRDALLTSATGRPRHWPDHSDAFRRLSVQLGGHQLLQLARRLVQRQRYFQQHVQPSFFLHDLIL